MKRTGAIILSALILISCLAGCGTTTGQSEVPTPSSAQSTDVSQIANNANPAETVSNAVSALNVSYSAKDTDSTWSDVGATTITMNGNAIKVSGAGASANGSILTISTAGTFILSGTLENGQILISAGEKDDVHIVLNGSSITNKTGAAIYATSADKLIITLAEGTQNTVTDGGKDFAYTIAVDEEPNAAIFANCDLSLNGSGSLTVNAGFNNGIGTQDDLVISGGNYNITAVNDGLRGRDSVSVLDGSIRIDAGGDGISSNNDEDTTKGWVSLAGGDISIKAGAKGVKAVTELSVSDGNISIDSTDDSIHSNGSITISGGDLELSTGDDGVHADISLTVTNGKINIIKSTEGLESASVLITGGEISVVSTDDGINASGDTNNNIVISGGVITLYTSSDGIDSNGTLDVTGGTVAVFVNAPRDGDTTDVNNGGTIQPTLYGSTTVKAGTKIAVGDWSITAASDATAFCLMIPGIVNGQSYNITANGAALATVTATTNIQGMMGGGGGQRSGGGRK